VGKLAYFDCPTGIAGDMCLGALVDLGVPIDYLREQLDRLGIGAEYRLRAASVKRNDQTAMKVYVDLRDRSGALFYESEGGEILPIVTPADPRHYRSSAPPPPASGQSHDHSHSHSPATQDQGQGPEHAHPHSHPHLPDRAQTQRHDHTHHHNHNHHHDHEHTRTFTEIAALIQAAQLPDRVTAWSLAVFRNLAEAEGAVHGVLPDRVQFHEVGGIDAIVDIVGTCLGLNWFDVDTIHCSALPTGGGTVRAAHGRLPVPVPAVLKLWQGRSVALYHNGINKELVTPTGAALMVTLAKGFGAPPPMQLDRVGWGAGTINLPIPNALRLWLGEPLDYAFGSSFSSSFGSNLKQNSSNHTLNSTLNQDFGVTSAAQRSQPLSQQPSQSDPYPSSERVTSGLGVSESSISGSGLSELGVSERVTSVLADSSSENYVQPELTPDRLGLDDLDPDHSNHVERYAEQQDLELGTSERVTVLETQVDDLSPQAIGYLFDRLLQAGALDVFTTAVGMKKSRTGQAITVICPPDRRIACETLLFQETTTLGIRHREQWRSVLARSMQTVNYDGRSIRVKLAFDRQGQCLNVQPEYEDVALVARETGRSWLVVQRAAINLALSQIAE